MKRPKSVELGASGVLFVDVEPFAEGFGDIGTGVVERKDKGGDVVSFVERGFGIAFGEVLGKGLKEELGVAGEVFLLFRRGRWCRPVNFHVQIVVGVGIVLGRCPRRHQLGQLLHQLFGADNQRSGLCYDARFDDALGP